MVFQRTDVAKAFGKVLREQRRRRGLSQEQLGKICELDRTYPSLLERGLRTPTLTIIYRLAEALEISIVRLVALTDEELSLGGKAKTRSKTTERLTDREPFNSVRNRPL